MTDQDSAARRAEMFDLEIDPLSQFEPKFRQLEEEFGDDDPLEQYVDKIQRRATGNVEETIDHYERTFRQWRDHMSEAGRHPACPHKNHVLEFIDDCIDRRDNKGGTVASKIERLSNAYEWWQSSDDWPHKLSYHPFSAALDERNLEDDDAKQFPDLSLDEVREVVQGISHITDRALVGLHLKLGCRSSELGNIKLSEIHIDHPDLQEHYPEMGTHDMLDGRKNAVYIPHDRRHNKRERPTVIPLDEEARRLLIDWLLARPDTGDPWVFMTHKGEKVTRTDLRYIWTQHWWPEYEKPEEGSYRSITPHFARHVFSTWWRREVDANREVVMYLRGDKTDMTVGDTADALDHYVHTHYEQVEDIYRDKIFQLYV